MAVPPANKRRAQDSDRNDQRQRKRFKKQSHYSSDSEPEAEAAPPSNERSTTGSAKKRDQLGSSHHLEKAPSHDAPSASASEGSEPSPSDSDLESDSASDASDASANNAHPTRARTKRHDPSAFASSLSAILGSKLGAAKRADPVLSRSKDAHDAAHAVAEGKLEARARRQLRDERRVEAERGRVKDVLLGDRRAAVGEDDDGVAEGEGGASAAEVALVEKRLRKTAQRGVVRLFNAVRAAQARGEEEARKARQKGVVGMGRRDEKVGEMGRKAFLELVGKGGEEVR